MLPLVRFMFSSYDSVRDKGGLPWNFWSQEETKGNVIPNKFRRKIFVVEWSSVIQS